MLTSRPVLALENHFTVSLQGNEINIGDSISLSDPIHSYYLNKEGKYKSAYSRVFLELNETGKLLLDSTFNINIYLKVSFLDTAGQVIDIPMTLQIDFDKGSLSNYQRKEVFHMEHVVEAKLKVISISDTTLLRYVRLGIDIGNEFYWNFNPNTSVRKSVV